MINLGTQLKRKGHIAASHVVLLKWMLNLSVMMTVTIRKKILQDVKFNIIFFVSNILANFRLNQIDSSRCYAIRFGQMLFYKDCGSYWSRHWDYMLNEYEKWYQMVQMKIITIMTVITFSLVYAFHFSYFRVCH